MKGSHVTVVQPQSWMSMMLMQAHWTLLHSWCLNAMCHCLHQIQHQRSLNKKAALVHSTEPSVLSPLHVTLLSMSILATWTMSFRMKSFLSRHWNLGVGMAQLWIVRSMFLVPPIFVLL